MRVAKNNQNENLGADERARLLRIGVWAQQYRRWGRDLIAGAFRHAMRDGHCEIRFFDEDDPNPALAIRRWKPDGLILSGHLPAGLRPPRRLPCPAVLANLPASAVNGPVVAVLEIDENKVAGMVADLFLRRGLRAFAYVGDGSGSANGFSEKRLRGFVARLAGKGYDCATCGGAGSRGRARARSQDDLAAWLLSLPKPCGLMVCNDERGKAVLDACRHAGISVPDQLCVVSVDDETLFCETCTPPLSSVRHSHEEAGCTAAQLLCEALQTGHIPCEPEFVPYSAPLLVERASSLDWRGGSRVVSAAREWIGRNATRQGLHARDVAAAVGVSTRLLHLRFSEAGGLTVRQEIENARMRKVEEMLLRTSDPIGDIGAACGFSSDSHLKERFRNRHGCTMGRFRTGARSARPQGPCGKLLR